MKPTITFDDFNKIDIRIGTIIEVNNFPEAIKSAYKLKIDFGVLGIKKSSAQITTVYSKEILIGKKVSAVVNFKSRQIANFKSEVLVLGIQKGEEVVLINSKIQSLRNGQQIL